MDPKSGRAPREQLLVRRRFSFDNVHVAPRATRRRKSTCASGKSGGRRRGSGVLGSGRSQGAARVAAGLAVVPVTAQVDLESQQAVGRGSVLAAFI